MQMVQAQCFLNLMVNQELLRLLIKSFQKIEGVSYKKTEGSYAYTPTPPVNKELFNQLFLEFPQTYEMPHKIFWNILKETSANQDLGASEFVFSVAFSLVSCSIVISELQLNIVVAENIKIR